MPGFIGKLREKLNERLWYSHMKRGADAANDILNAADAGDVKKLERIFGGMSREEMAGATIADMALAAAAEGGQTAVAAFLLEHGVRPEAPRSSTNPEAVAAARGDTQFLDLLYQFTVKAGGTPSTALAEAHQKTETARKESIDAAAAQAPVLQHNLTIRAKPLKVKK